MLWLSSVYSHWKWVDGVRCIRYTYGMTCGLFYINLNSTAHYCHESILRINKNEINCDHDIARHACEHNIAHFTYTHTHQVYLILFHIYFIYFQLQFNFVYFTPWKMSLMGISALVVSIQYYNMCAISILLAQIFFPIVKWLHLFASLFGSQFSLCERNSQMFFLVHLFICA